MKNKKIIYLVVFLIKNYYLIDFIVIIIFVIFFINLFNPNPEALSELTQY